ncbi:MAG: hypothetical protein GXP48_04100, partial [Acidobacteria bacterium]|nr:hypothetical protein [Acidobacteriota bacterium]
MKETLKRIIVENQERMPFQLFPRHTPTLLKTRQIHAIIGLRRVGKTYFLYQIINELLERPRAQAGEGSNPAFKTVAGLNFSRDQGAFYENAVLLELIRRGDEPFFFEDHGKCDFVVKRGDRITESIQVSVDPEGRERERRGLLAAARELGLTTGTIIT